MAIASLVAASIKSLAVNLDVWGATSTKIEQVFDMNLPVMKSIKKPIPFFNDPPAQFELGDLPLQPFAGFVQVRHAFDITRDFNGELDTGAIGEIMSRNAYAELPEVHVKYLMVSKV
jgi:hypothetical protein